MNTHQEIVSALNRRNRIERAGEFDRGGTEADVLAALKDLDIERRIIPVGEAGVVSTIGDRWQDPEHVARHIADATGRDVVAVMRAEYRDKKYGTAIHVGAVAFEVPENEDLHDGWTPCLPPMPDAEVVEIESLNLAPAPAMRM